MHATSPDSSSFRIASRAAAREIRSVAASSRSDGSVSPTASSPRSIIAPNSSATRSGEAFAGVAFVEASERIDT